MRGSPRRGRAILVTLLAMLAALLTFTAPASAQERSDTTLSHYPLNPAVGQSVRLTAEATCSTHTGGGSVTFTDVTHSTIIATVPLGPGLRASTTARFASVGSHTIRADFEDSSGDCPSSYDTDTVTVSAKPLPSPWPRPHPPLPLARCH